MAALAQNLSADDLGIPESKRRVYENRPIRLGSVLGDLSSYHEEVWNLNPLVLQQHQPGLSLVFRTVPPQFRGVARELASALLTQEPPPGESVLSVSTIASLFRNVRDFFQWMDVNHHSRVADLTAEDLIGYLDILWGPDAAKGKREKATRALKLLYVYRDHLRNDYLSVDPRLISGWNRPLERRSLENVTPRIPEAVTTLLVSSADLWVRTLADDILSARSEYERLRDQSPRFTRKRGAGAQGLRDLESIVAKYVQTGRKLPGHTYLGEASEVAVNMSHLAREAGCTMDVVQRLGKNMLADAIAAVGIDSDTYLWTEPTARVGPRVWRGPIRFWDTPELVELLSAACYILIAFYSGMRDSEIKHLRRGCYRSQSDSSGLIVRRTLDGVAFKGERTATGVSAQWVVGEPVEKAIEILERIQPESEQHLFAGFTHQINRRNTVARPLQTTSRTNQCVNRFLAWSIQNVGRWMPGCEVNSEASSWRLTTKQFRRTLAWFIARRPGGSIAGAIQFRHQSVQMFEGYAGTSASGFRLEVEAELAIERGEFLLAAVERNEHKDLTGPSADEARLRMQAFGATARFQGIVAESPGQLKKLIAVHDPQIYPGRFVTCVFNPERALCTRSSKGPEQGSCEPLDCKNVALSAANKSEWLAQLAQLDANMAAGEALAPYVLSRLEGHREAVVSMLGR